MFPQSIATAEIPGAMFARAECGSSTRLDDIQAPAKVAWLIKPGAELPPLPKRQRQSRKPKPWPVETILSFNDRLWHPHLVMLCEGDHVAALALGEILYWEQVSKKTGKRRANQEHDGKLWAAIGPSDWWESMLFTRQTARTATEALERMELIEIGQYMFGGSKTTHYRTTAKAQMTPKQLAALAVRGEWPEKFPEGPRVESNLCGDDHGLKSTCVEGDHGLKVTSNTTGLVSTDSFSTDSPLAKKPSQGKTHIPETKSKGIQGKQTSKSKPTLDPTPSCASPPLTLVGQAPATKAIPDWVLEKFGPPVDDRYPKADAANRWASRGGRS